MESLDRRIVNLLANDSSASISELVDQLGVPSSTLHQRIKKLEARGVIRGYRAIVDQRAVGLGLHALVSLTPIDPSRPDDVAEQLAPIQEVESCWSVAGTESYIVKVAVSEPGDLEALREMMALLPKHKGTDKLQADLKAKGVDQIDEVRIDTDPHERQKMMDITGRRTVPQIFIGDTHVGGCDDLIALDGRGGLVPLLQAA
mgnify:CR=1 FL=1